MTDSQKQVGGLLNTLSIPSPGETFAALNIPCHPNWVTLVTPATVPITTDRTQLALAMGVLAANGYIAMEAQDGQQVKNVGTEMMVLGKALGLSANLMGREKSLIEFAEKNDWNALRGALKATENGVTTAMIDQKDQDLVILTAASTWLREMEIATQIVLSSDTLQGSSVVKQPKAARELSSQLDTLPERMKKGLLVSAMKQTLDETVTLMETMGGTPETEKPVLQRIHDEMAGLVKKILTSPDAKPSPSPAQTPAVTQAVMKP